MTESRPNTPASAGPTRRQVLRGGAALAAGVGVATTVGACASGDGGDKPGAEKTLEQPVSVAKTEVPVGSGVIRMEERLVVTQPTEGDFHAFSAVCPHQGCLVSLIRNDAIVCSCHTSLFGLTDGKVISGPARGALPPFRVTDDGTNLKIG